MTFINPFIPREDHETGELIKRATQFSLSPTERARMRAMLATYVEMRPVRRIGTPTSTRFALPRLFHPLPAIAAVLVLAVGVGTAGAAEVALPGDFLYPVKVHVTEEVRAALALDAHTKAEWALARAERRLAEVETLAEAGRLNDETRVALEARFETHIETAEQKSVELEEQDDVQAAAEIESKIGAVHYARVDLAHAGNLAARVLQHNASTTIAIAKKKETAPRDTVRTEVAFMAVEAPATSIALDMRTAEEDDIRSDSENETIERTLRETRAAAQKRIASLERLLARSGTHISSEAQAAAKTELTLARTTFNEGEKMYKKSGAEEAFELFREALRLATEAHASLSHRAKIENSADTSSKKKEEKKTDEEKKSKENEVQEEPENETLKVDISNSVKVIGF